jgi:4-carboxymuconolactone decarboxylase
VLTDSPRSGNGTGGNINNPPFKVYLRSPEFGIEAIKISDYLRFGTELAPRLSELAIIIVARNWDNDCWQPLSRYRAH